MTISRASSIKLGKKRALLLKKISELFLEVSLDDQRIRGLTISRVALSKDKSLCIVYFYSPNGKEEFNEKLEILKLYKGSIRKALAQDIKGRYVPDLKFEYDDQFEKLMKVENLIEKLKKDGQL